MWEDLLFGNTSTLLNYMLSQRNVENDFMEVFIILSYHNWIKSNEYAVFGVCLTLFLSEWYIHSSHHSLTHRGNLYNSSPSGMYLVPTVLHTEETFIIHL